MALAGAELLAEFDVAELGLNALVGGVNTPDEGVNGAAWVMALEPAAAELEAENVVVAPGPDDPDDALA